MIYIITSAGGCFIGSLTNGKVRSACVGCCKRVGKVVITAGYYSFVSVHPELAVPSDDERYAAWLESHQQ